MRYLICFIILIPFFFSCSNKENLKNNSQVKPIAITSIDPEAIKLYRAAKMKLFNGENEEAKEIFLSSLEIDPNFFLANVDINESDVKLKQIYKYWWCK